MVVRSGLVAEARAAWIAALAAVGWKKRAGDVFTRVLTGDAIGWLGLNTAVGRSDGLLEVNPVLGVRHQGVEHLVAELTQEKFRRHVPATLSVHLGYVMPEGRYRPWLFGADQPVESAAREMVAAVVAYGLPFMERLSALDALADAMDDGSIGIGEALAFRRPAARLLLGESRGAEMALEEGRATLRTRQDQAAMRYRRFAEAFQARL